jgi:hypothetical protein
MGFFSANAFDLGNSTAIEHAIETTESKFIKQNFRYTPASFEGEEEKDIQKMLKTDVIEPSISEWASPTALVRENDGSVRRCADYRA